MLPEHRLQYAHKWATTLKMFVYYLGSTGYPAAIHTSKPPFSAFTFLKPLFTNIRATRALVASSGQVQ